MVKVDEIFYNGNIYTMENEKDKASAIAVYQGRIIDIGSDDEILKLHADRKTDLLGQTVLPGFIDSHCHIAESAEGRLKVDLTGAKTIEEVIERMKVSLPDVPTGKWLIGYQLSARTIGRLPNRYELDEISTDIPVYISEVGLHSYMGNSKLLEVAGISKGFCKEGYEFMEVDDDGEPTGIFREHAMLKYINAARPSIFDSKEHMKQELIRALYDWSEYGYTTLHSCDGFGDSDVDKMAVYQELYKDNRLKMRVILNKQYSVDNNVGVISGIGNDYIKYGGYKIFTDGSFSGRSAFLKEDYMDSPGNKGRTAHSFEEYRKLIKHAYELGNDLAIHIIGDGGMEWALKVIEEIYDPSRKQQFELIHASLIDEDQWDRLNKYPVVIATQPIMMPDMEHSKRFRLGEKRGNLLLAFKSWKEHGLIVAGGEDGPIYPYNPFESMYYTITRQIRDGVYLNEKEALSVYDAVAMYTKNASYCAHEENLKGTLSRGKLADFVVLEDDIFTLTPDEIRKLKVAKTYLGGELVYKNSR
ncbi:MAG: amidohydrolase [Lachnospira sp.]